MPTKTEPTEGRAVKNLWGTLPIEPSVLAPVAILRQQGDLLARATDGLLITDTRVVQLEFDKYAPGGFQVTMHLVATALNNYHFQILTVTHGIELYPAWVVAEQERMECEDQDAFEEAVEKVLQSDRVHRAISGLLAQMRSN